MEIINMDFDTRNKIGNLYYEALEKAFKLEIVNNVRYDNPELIEKQPYGYDATFSESIENAYKKLREIAEFLEQFIK